MSLGLFLAAASATAAGDWGVCVYRAAKELAAQSTEPATTIADAALSMCRQKEMDARQAWIDEGRREGKNSVRWIGYWDAKVPELREDLRQDAILTVLDARKNHAE